VSIPIIAFFNNKGGVGKTSLVYHLSWMLADLGYVIVAADLDPQANLTAAFLDEQALAEVWAAEGTVDTIYEAVQPLMEGVGDVATPSRCEIEDRLSLVAGDLSLTQFEDQLTDAWPRCLESDVRSFRVVSAFWRVLQAAGSAASADVILMDLGPNLGAINRSALIASDYVVVPLAPDLFSIRGLENLGPKLREWRTGWEDRLNRRPAQLQMLPTGQMEPSGYIVQQHAVRLDRPVRAYDTWIARIPGTYRRSVLNLTGKAPASFEADANCLALVKNFRSLIPMAQEARKPIFHLRAADGAIGGHQTAVQDARTCFLMLADKIAERTFLVHSDDSD
jgi:chromosome partitioning protein